MRRIKGRLKTGCKLNCKQKLISTSQCQMWLRSRNFGFRRDGRRKIWADPQFVHGVNQAADVVAEHLAQHFVVHGRIGFAANMVTELRFNHADG